MLAVDTDTFVVESTVKMHNLSKHSERDGNTYLLPFDFYSEQSKPTDQQLPALNMCFVCFASVNVFQQ